jgi:GT2 family glycosyltransferase
MSKLRVAVLIAVHNRWEYTREVISRLTKENDFFDFCVHVVDDGSTDETQTHYHDSPRVTFIRTAGNNYWAKSMKVAQDSISEPIDFFLWLNNDVLLVDDFFRLIYRGVRDNPHCILVGQTSNARTNMATYGGLNRLGRHPLRFSEVKALSSYTNVDTFHGNIVLIPADANSILGGIDGGFQHGYADLDFGLRAIKSGFTIRALPGFLGICERNPNPFVGLSRWESLKTVLSIKFLPLRSQIRYCRRHGGVVWPIYVISPYLKILRNKSIQL